MRRSLATLVVVMTACSPSKSQQPMTLEQKTADIAKGMNAIAPKELGNGLTLMSVSSEGKTLVMTLKGLQVWRPYVSDAEVAKVFGTTLCAQQGIQRAVREGALFRVDGFTAEGARLPPQYLCERQK